jgi:hypothetical protein
MVMTREARWGVLLCVMVLMIGAEAPASALA